MKQHNKDTTKTTTKQQQQQHKKNQKSPTTTTTTRTTKEPDYVMSLMSTYGTNNRDNGKETRRNWKVGGEARTTSFRYPEVVHNHFLYRHAVDDHNGKRHSTISLEVIWATKRWPN